MSGLTEEDLKREALALGGELEIGGEHFNTEGVQMAVKARAAAALEPDPNAQLLGKLDSLIDALHELARKGPEK